MKPQLFVSSSPHVFVKQDTSSIMMDVLIALMPAALVGMYFFGLQAVFVIALSTFSAVAFEWIILKLFKRPGSVQDLSAAVTGLLLGMNLPVTTPWWMIVIGSMFAIAIVKHPFGGLGHNFMNPALAARAFLVACWPIAMTANFIAPSHAIDIVSSASVDVVSYATPMTLLKGGSLDLVKSMLPLAIGNVGGSIGETSAIALLIGGIYLVARRIIRWRVPVIYILTVFVLTFLLGGFDLNLSFVHVLGGGLMIGAIFMATDYSTSPVTPTGQIIMGIGCGVLTAIIRLYSKSPEGVSYSILLMNVAVPLIDRFTRPKIFGEVRHHE